MFRKFAGGGEQSWPLSKIMAALENNYGALDLLGEDGPLTVYGVQDNGVNFVIALLQTGPGSGKVQEFGFLARFVGFDVSEMLVESLNRNLHIAVASIEAGGDLFLMAGMQAAGTFDARHFQNILESWRRDLMVTLQGISNSMASMADAFPAARLEAARNFAVNAAPARTDGRPVDMLASYLGARSMKAVCDDCGGRGKRGFIARICAACDGSGFIKAR